MIIVPEQLEQFRESLRTALEERRHEDAAAIASQLSAARFARMLREAPRDSVMPTLTLIEDRRAGQIFGQLPPSFAAELLEEGELDVLAPLMSRVPPDHAADILEDLEEDRRNQLLERLSPEVRANLEKLRTFAPQSAGSVMTTSFLAVEKGRTVGQVLSAILAAPPDTERSSYIYVVDAKRKPIGVISIKDLLGLDPAKPVEDVMNPNVIAVHTGDSAVEAAKLIRNRRFTMIPVLDDDDAIIGVVTFEDAMDILAEDVAGQFVTAGVREESFFTPPMSSVRMRLPWMAANVFLNLGAVAIITGFEETIAAVAILAAFLPMITDMGGNVGIQSLSVAIRSLALGEVRVRDFSRAIRKELIVGIVNGIALGLLFAVVATVWQGNPLIGILAGAALCTNVLVAGVVGGTLPFLIKRLGKDPAMMTGPILTTITDITGVTIYLGLCTIFLLPVGG